jgi:hypothetical protein
VITISQTDKLCWQLAYAHCVAAAAQIVTRDEYSKKKIDATRSTEELAESLFQIWLWGVAKFGYVNPYHEDDDDLKNILALARFCRETTSRGKEFMSNLRKPIASLAGRDTDKLERDVASFSRFLDQSMQGLLSSNYHMMAGEVGPTAEEVFQSDELIEAAAYYAEAMVKKVAKFESKRLHDNEESI